MGYNTNRNKPANPAPPLNALKNPEVTPPPKKEQPVRRAVQDEIAERRKKEKHKIGVTSHDTEEETYRSIDEIGDIIDELKQNREDDDVKVYTPHENNESHELHSRSDYKEPAIPEYPEDIYSDDDEVEDYADDEENYDVPPIPKQSRRIGLWVAIISALSVLCVIAAGAYGVVNGYFDGIISML